MDALTTNQRHIVGTFMQATSLEIEQGVQWYEVAYKTAQRIAYQYKLDTETVAAVIAALSPNNKWERNCKDAENVIAAYTLGSAKDAKAVKVCTYGKNLAKAIAILESDDLCYEIILSGPKVIEFYHCIIGVTDVCIDGHAYSIWFGERLTMKQVPSIGKKLRQTIKDDYIAATQFINDNSDDRYTPAMVQAITWVTHKRIYEV